MTQPLQKFICQTFKVQVGSKFPAGMPFALTRSDVDSLFGIEANTCVQYVVSPKADGERMFLAFCPPQMCFLVNRSWRHKQLAWSSQAASFEGTLFDVEVIPTTHNKLSGILLLLFDCMSVFGNSTMEASYPARLQIIDEWLLQNYALATKFELPMKDILNTQQILVYHVCPKVFIAKKPVFYIRHSAQLVQTTFSFATDGLIFTPVHLPVCCYAAPQLKKWKPPHLLTVDFYVRVIVNEQVTDKGHPWNHFQLQESQMTLGLFLANHELFSWCRRTDRYNQAGVYECAFVNNEWVISSLRYDKSSANSWVTVLQTLQCLLIPVTIQDLEILDALRK